MLDLGLPEMFEEICLSLKETFKDTILEHRIAEDITDDLEEELKDKLKTSIRDHKVVVYRIPHRK